jgi:hypothetical protein
MSTKRYAQLPSPAPKAPETIRQTPPPLRNTPVAHAGRERLDDTPAILDPAVAVRIGKLGDSAEIQVDVERTNPLEMETGELRSFLRKAVCVDRREFSPERFANSIMIAQVRKESENGARFIFIRTDDGQVWRLYPAAENIVSVEKFEKCRFSATLRADGKTVTEVRIGNSRPEETRRVEELYFLYWETPELERR